MLIDTPFPPPDREIFRLRDELATYEGSDVTFYDFLDVSPSASQDDINKAYRKKSRSLHPDKVKQQLTAERTKAKKKNNKDGSKPGVNVAKPPSQSEIKTAIKAASDRQARLSIVANILKGPGRARYDHFMANGFPVWKGTNYFYERYRPGLGTVMTGVFIALGGGAHYLALYMGWKRQREFVERYIKFARHAAWGDNLGIPAVDVGAIGTGTAAPPPPPAEEAAAAERAMPTNRKMRRMQEREAKREASQDGTPSRRSTRKAAPRAASVSASGAATPTPAAGGPQGAKKRVVAENGKVLVVDSLGDVYLEQDDEEGNVQEFLLDVSLTLSLPPAPSCFPPFFAADPLADRVDKTSPMRFSSLESATPPSYACPSGSMVGPSVASSPRRTMATTMRRSRRRTPRSAQTLRTLLPRRTPRPARAASAHPAPALPTTTLSCWTSRWRTSAPQRRQAAKPRGSRARAASARARGSKCGNPDNAVSLSFPLLREAGWWRLREKEEGGGPEGLNFAHCARVDRRRWVTGIFCGKKVVVVVVVHRCLQQSWGPWKQ